MIVTKKIIKIIEKNNIIDKKSRINHVKNIKTKIKIDDDKINNMICPKCGGTLVERNSKFGKFIDCSNYPKCNFKKRFNII